jgi:hypothetical protein
MPLPNVQVFGKPIEKLIETVSKAIGVIYKPKAIRNEADAKAYEIEAIATAKANASIIKSDAESEIAERAKIRLYHQEMNRQMNIDSIVDICVGFLNKTVAEEPVEENWRARFFLAAQDVFSTDLQVIWGKILASEVNKPGVTSLRTLNILANISKDEALIFAEFCGLANQFGDVIRIANGDLQKYGIPFSDLLLLEEIGLINTSNDIGVKYTAHPITMDKPINGVALKFKTRGIVFYKEDISEYDFSVYSLTRSGRELFESIPSNQSDLYYEDLREELIKLKYTIYETRAVYVLRENINK